MPIIRAQVTLDHLNGIPRDGVQNTWHFNPATFNNTVGNAIGGALEDFYTANTGSVALTDFLSLQMAGTGLIKMYDLADTPPRVPVFEYPLEWTNSETTTLPSEVAVTFSFQGARESGAPQARRRGRVFLGLLNLDAMAATNTPRPATALLNHLAAAGSDLITNSAAGDAPWVVYSRANDAVAVVVDGWIDNAFDTQRRRGASTTSRTTF